MIYMEKIVDDISILSERRRHFSEYVMCSVMQAISDGVMS